MAEFDKKQEDDLINVMVSNKIAARRVLGLAASIIAAHEGKSIALVMVEESARLVVDQEMAAMMSIAATMIDNSGKAQGDVPDD